jgi:hypothetical protein
VRADARRAARRALRVAGASWLAAAPAACTSFRATAPNGVRPGASLQLRAARGVPAATVHAVGPEGGPAPDARCLAHGVEGRVAESRGPAADTLRLVRFAVVPARLAPRRLQAAGGRGRRRRRGVLGLADAVRLQLGRERQRMHVDLLSGTAGPGAAHAPVRARPTPNPHTVRMSGLRHARVATALALAFATCTATACHSWRAVALPKATPSAEAQERAVRGPVRATRADGRRLRLGNTRIAHDTLHGVSREPGGRASTVAIPLDSIQHLEARRVSVLKTGGLVLGVVAAWFVLALAAISAAGPGLP